MERYARQVPLLGLDGQARLGRSSIAVIGLGGVLGPLHPCTWQALELGG